MKVIVITASGTGGHVYPAYTMALEYIQKGYNIIWIGTKNGLENRVINHESINIVHISSQGIRGKSFLKKILALLYFIKSIFQSFIILRKYKPGLVLGFGGYVSVGASLSSYFLSIPVVTHEQNAIAGTANKINYYLSNKVYETFPLSFNKTNNKIIHTGNPVRSCFDNITKPEEKYSDINASINILILGGSQGSSFFNTTMPFAISHFYSDNISIKHISGFYNDKNVKEKYTKYNINASVLPYSDNINDLFDWSCLVICRAGSTKISELAKIGRASLLIPFPHATDDHQLLNANHLAINSATILLEEKEDFIENFVSIVNILLNDQKRMYMLSKNIQNIFPENANKFILEDSLKYFK